MNIIMFHSRYGAKINREKYSRTQRLQLYAPAIRVTAYVPAPSFFGASVARTRLSRIFCIRRGGPSRRYWPHHGTCGFLFRRTKKNEAIHAIGYGFSQPILQSPTPSTRFFCALAARVSSIFERKLREDGCQRAADFPWHVV